MMYMYMCGIYMYMCMHSMCMSICTIAYMYMCGIYMNIHVPSMLAIGVETINKQTQQTNKQPQWLIKFIKHSHKGLRKY